MPMNSAWLTVDPESATRALQDALDNVDEAGGELVLDFSSVCRIDTSALTVIEQLAETARDKAVKVVLRGVNVEVYKVLKLVKLTPSFTFLE